jgi:hypothetical protein
LPLTADEKAILWRMLLRRLLVGAVYLFFGGIAVFLFGLIIVFVWGELSDKSTDFAMLRWLISCYLMITAAGALFFVYRYIKHPLHDLLQGQKLYTIAVVTDRQEIRTLNNRDKVHYELYLNNQPFRVIQSAYDSITIGEKLMTAQAPRSKVIFSITLADGTVI